MKFKSLYISFFASAVLMALSSSTLAQWPLHMEGIPLLPDGSPDFDASTPRTLDGKPDLSGTWDFPFPHQSGVQGRPVGEPRNTSSRCYHPMPHFGTRALVLKMACPINPGPERRREERIANHGIENPDSYCLPLGHMQFHTHPQPFEVIQSPERLVILYEASSGVREVFLDGRPLPTLGGPIPTWYGYSVGHWEGDTLVVVPRTIFAW